MTFRIAASSVMAGGSSGLNHVFVSEFIELTIVDQIVVEGRFVASGSGIKTAKVEFVNGIHRSHGARVNFNIIGHQQQKRY